MYDSKKGEKELKGSGGRDASSYKSEVGGAGMKSKKMDKLAAQAGGEAKSKDAAAYKSAKLSD